jgi:hypothetical protein
MCREKIQQLQAASRCDVWFDPGMIGRRQNQPEDRSFSARLRVQTERQWWVTEPSCRGRSGSSPLPRQRRCASAGLRWWRAMVRRDPERSHDMAKRKARTSAKPRSATKTRSVPFLGQAGTADKRPRDPSTQRCTVPSPAGRRDVLIVGGRSAQDGGPKYGE